MITTPPMETRTRDLTNALIWHTAASIGLDAMVETTCPDTAALVEMLTRHGFRDALIRALQCQATDLTEAEAEAERITFHAYDTKSQERTA
jgi:hypothetical protein